MDNNEKDIFNQRVRIKDKDIRKVFEAKEH